MVDQSTELLPIEVVTSFMNSAPVDVDGLARKLGIAVHRLSLGPDVSGSISCSQSGRCEIQINSDHSRTRQRFTLAHEIAHYIFHRDLIGDGIRDNARYRSNQPEEIERQASQLAARILMPAHLVRQAYRSGTSDPRQLSALFAVSPAVAEIRMSELGLNTFAPIWPAEGSATSASNSEMVQVLGRIQEILQEEGLSEQVVARRSP